MADIERNIKHNAKDGEVSDEAHHVELGFSKLLIKPFRPEGLAYSKGDTASHVLQPPVSPQPILEGVPREGRIAPFLLCKVRNMAKE